MFNKRGVKKKNKSRIVMSSFFPFWMNRTCIFSIYALVFFAKKRERKKEMPDC